MCAMCHYKTIMTRGGVGNCGRRVCPILYRKQLSVYSLSVCSPVLSSCRVLRLTLGLIIPVVVIRVFPRQQLVQNDSVRVHISLLPPDIIQPLFSQNFRRCPELSYNTRTGRSGVTELLLNTRTEGFWNGDEGQIDGKLSYSLHDMT